MRRVNQAATFGANIPEPDFTVGSNNRLAAPVGFTLSYDASGNLINDNYTGQGPRLYDALNRMTKAWSNNQWQTYTYDARGQRIKRNVSGIETWQVYGIAGELLAEYAAGGDPSGPQKEYGYRNGELLVAAEPSPSTRTNYALASNGATAMVSSTFSLSFPASSLNNGDRKGLQWGNGGGWRDSEPANTFPDWAEIDFPAAKTIDEVDVFTVQDNYASPAEPSEALTFSMYGLTGYSIQYWSGNSWTTVPSGTITGNNKVWRRITFTPLSTTKIRVLTNSAVDGYSRLVEVEAWGNAVAARTNVALAANGGFATASSQQTSAFPASGTINGDRKGLGWENGGGWRDGEPRNSFPDWLQVDFNGSKTIDEVDVFTIQDNYANPAEPTEQMTFSAYGQTGYDVQYWNSDTSGWTTVSGGSITGNNKVWRKITFPAVTTTKIRVLTNGAADGYSRLVEVEAWSTTLSGSGAANINWVVADQLGTPRMVFDKSGSLANMRRHDYLPFGEELPAGTGTRTTSQGYGLSDRLRQKFTSKERDSETGLDYFLARHYQSAQGRFISPDPLLASARPANPQTWNRYAYALNNPLRFVDPNGLEAHEDLHDLQQPNPPQGPQPLPSPQPLVTTQNEILLPTTIPLTNITFYTEIVGQPSSIVEVDQPVNDIMNVAITQMANNDLNAMGALTQMQLHPGTGAAISLSLSFQTGASPSINWTLNKTFYVHSPEEVLLQTAIANHNIQGGAAAALIKTESWVATCERRRLGDVRSPEGNLGASMAGLARDMAQSVALTTYQQRYNANPPPQSMPR